MTRKFLCLERTRTSPVQIEGFGNVIENDDGFSHRLNTHPCRRQTSNKTTPTNNNPTPPKKSHEPPLGSSYSDAVPTGATPPDDCVSGTGAVTLSGVDGADPPEETGSAKSDTPPAGVSDGATVAGVSGDNVPAGTEVIVVSDVDDVALAVTVANGVAVADGVAVTVFVPEGIGVGATVSLPPTGVNVAVGSKVDGVTTGVSAGGSCVGGGSVGGGAVGGPGVDVIVGTVQFSCSDGIAQAVGIIAKPDSANMMSSHPINIQCRLFIAHSPCNT